MSNRITSRIGIAAIAAATAGALLVAPNCAFADTEHVTAAAYRAAAPSIEILGADSVEESGQFVDTTNWYSWVQPKYNIFANPTYNQSYSQQLYNLAYNKLNNLSSTDEGYKTPQAIFHSKRTGSGNGPNQALGTSDSDDVAIATAADVVVGSGGAASTATVKNYKCASYEELCDTMDDIAAGLDAQVTKNKTLRYGSAAAIASQYRQFVFGTKGLVAQYLANNPNDVATIAWVTAYDEDTGTYTISSQTIDGTAKSNRYLETVAGVTVNYADDEEVKVSAVEAADLIANVDWVLVGGQSSSKNCDDIVDRLHADGVDNVYYVEGNGSNGSCYGVVMNSVENAQNMARILGTIYPKVINQENYICYYYDNFYHINNAYLGKVIDEAMDGVYNEESNTTEWTESDAAAYVATGSTVEDEIEAALASGYAYYQANLSK